MKSNHKAATAVSIASTTEETAFRSGVQRHWKNGAVLVVAVAAGIMIRQWMGAQEEAAIDESWGRMREAVSFTFVVDSSSPDELATLATELEGGQAAPWAKALEVGARVEAGDYSGAEQALGEWEARWPDHQFLGQEWTIDESGKRQTLPMLLRERLGAIEAWEQAHPNVLVQPEPEASLPPELQALVDQGLEITPSGPPPGLEPGDAQPAEAHGPGDGHDH